jgi:hypothetical protein
MSKGHTVADLIVEINKMVGIFEHKRRARGESGADARALQNLAEFRKLPARAKRLGVRRASAALVLKQASWPSRHASKPVVPPEAAYKIKL